MQILHRFVGSIQRYSEELSDPDRYRPDHCPQCEAHRPLRARGFYTRTLVDNRRDVLATAELAAKLLEEYGKHPIALQPTNAYSAASIGKAYLHSMGIKPILDRQPDFPKEYLGYTQTAFFGGRTSADIRKISVPVVYTDFLSMYPTVNSPMGLWRYVTAREIRVVEHSVDEIRAVLEGITKAALSNPETWKTFPA